MRLLANIVLEMRRLKQDDTLDGKCVIYRDHFQILEQSVESMSTTEGGSLKGGIKLKIGYLLKKLIKVCKGYCIQIKDMSMAEEADRFASLLDLNWDFIFYSAQLRCEQRSSLRKPKELPKEQDLAKLRNSVLFEMKKLGEDTYKK
ncbi:hypothetical protein PoB_006780200 [Plakobranchus ocellatus]|uniref:Uncharacterized protein n=1 Tax=Plakobranchus ocellatus TaxID=259542 RepID=A0AAV4DAK7_9GAST|nr:hypothetical protein PoB_006780200 [Plakobranchus ocellatus]